MTLTRLKILNMENPLGIDQIPYFSWVMQSPEKDVMQTAYRIVISAGNGVIVWDSGKIESERSTFVEYAGQKLAARTRYQVAVTVWDNKGNCAENARAWFETALPEQEKWQAQWAKSLLPRGISAEGYGNQPPPTLFRKDFFLKEPVAKARLYATCHGIYRLSINGVRPDEREFAPENTSYHKYLCYQTYDVTEHLKPGKNTIGMYVGDGWYSGPKTQPDVENFDPSHSILFQLEAEYAGGGTEIIISDEAVKTSHGPVLFSDLFAGEKYDANLEIEHWDTPAFDDIGWAPAGIADFGYHNLAAQIGQPVRSVMEVPAVRAYVSVKGENIVDFGQVLAGRVRMRVDAPKGAEIVLEHFEVTDKDESFFNNIMSEGGGVGGGCDQKTTYVAKGGIAVYEPLFTFQGFRYIRVSGLDNVRPEDFTAVVLSSEKENVGSFECSDAKLNRLYENTRWSQRSNMLSIPTDCPQREKAGWTGDILIYATTSLLNEDTTPLLTRWLKNLAVDQQENGAVPIVVPYHKFFVKMAEGFGALMGNEGPMGSAGWGDAAVMVPWSMYDITGNTVILRQQYHSMKQWCDYIIHTAKTQRSNKELPEEVDAWLWNTGFHFGDWLIPSMTKNGYDFETIQKAVEATRTFTAPIFGWQSVSRMGDIAALLGEDADSLYYSDVAAKMKEAIQIGVIDENGDPPAELMGAYVLLIYFDLVPERFKQRFSQRLVQLIEENGGCLDTGFLGTPYLLDALCKMGRRDMAYAMLFQEKCPSWLYEVNCGATSIWESWYVYKDDGTPLPMSLNHYAFGCVDDWMFRYIGGIDHDQPGFKHILIHPRPDERISWARRTYTSEYGNISCHWERSDCDFRMEVEIPCNTTATIMLPNGTQHEVGSGRHMFSC